MFYSPPEKYQIPPQGVIPPHLGTTGIEHNGRIRRPLFSIELWNVRERVK